MKNILALALASLSVSVAAGQQPQRASGGAVPSFYDLKTTTLTGKPGRDQSPVYALLGKSGHLPAWNFAKYVIGKDGHVVAFFPSDVTPESPELRQAIAKALGSN